MQNIQSIVARCQEGDLRAFATLFQYHQKRIFDLACTILKNEEDAKDAVQDTFIAVFQKIGTFRGESAFETWLIAIAVNTCRAKLRRNKVRRVLSLENFAPRWLAHVLGTQDKLEAVVEAQQRREMLWDMVDALDDRLRLPLILRYRYEYSCDEIAKILSRATNTIYEQLSEGRRQLRQMHQEQLAKQIPGSNLLRSNSGEAEKC
jgi:RNA polymerase sigma-70 factor (ECF subfamily)